MRRKQRVPRPKDIDQIFEDGTAIDQAVSDAVRDALLFHKRMGNPIATWRDGKVVWIPPEQIEVDDPAAPRAKPKRARRRSGKRARFATRPQ